MKASLGRKQRPHGTPCYYWGRLDKEFDLIHRRDGRRLMVNFADATGDLARDGRSRTMPKDLAQWHRQMDVRELPSRTAWSTLLTRGILNSGDTLRYALGIMHGTYRNLTTISHSGGQSLPCGVFRNNGKTPGLAIVR